MGTGAPNHMGLAASKDGRYLYYAAKNGGFSYNVTFPMWQIARLDRETGEVETLTSAQGSAVRPVLSPDQRWLVYGTRFDTETGLRIRSLETGDDRWLIYPIQRDDQESRFTRDLLPAYTFTPDGKSILLTNGGKIQRVDVTTGVAATIPFTAKVSQQAGPSLTTVSRVESGPVTVRQVSSPALSPDGRRVAFTAVDRLWVMDLPAGTPRRLTTLNAREFMPVWSPDGRTIVYVTWGGDGGHIWRIAPEGGQPTQLTRQSGFYSDPVFSPDGSKIVFLAGSRQARVEGQSASLYLRWIPAAGGESTLITLARAASYPHFADDSSRVYITISATGLTSMRLDGTDRKTHVKITGRGEPDPAPASAILLAPDGKQALAYVNSQIYLVTVPPPGAETPTVNVDSPPVPVRKLTDLGGEFMRWSADGKTATWALGSVFFRQTASAPKDAKPEETTVRIELPRHAPEGSVILRGAKVVTMKGHEIVENADVLVTGNKIESIGRRGQLKAPAGIRVIDVAGKTIIPGFVDVHAHLRLPRLVHDADIWSYLANLAYGVTTTRDPQTSTTDVFAYADLVEVGETIGPRIFATGPGVGASTNFKSLRGSRRGPEALQGILPHQHPQVVHGRRSQPAAVGRAGVEEIRHHADHGRRPRPEARPDARHRRLLGQRAQPADRPALQGRCRARGAVRHLLHADAARALRRAVGGELLLPIDRVHDDAKLRRFVPHTEVDGKAKRRPWFSEEEHAFPAARQGARRRSSRRAAGSASAAMASCRASVPLGDLGDAVGRDVQSRRAAGRYDLRRRGDRIRDRSRIASNRASSPICSFWIGTRWWTSATPTRSAT